MSCKKEIELESKINAEKECMKLLLLNTKKHVIADNLELAEECIKDFVKSLKYAEILVKELRELRRERLFGVVKKLNKDGCKVTTVSSHFRKELKA